MSLLLNGAKTMTIAGTEMQVLEIYTGEAYTLPISFTDSNGNPANALVPNAWNINASANFYTVNNVVYTSNVEVDLGNLTQLPSPPSANYTIQTAWTNAAGGLAYLYIGDNITNNPANGVPNVSLANSAANSVLCLITLTIAKQSASNSSLADINREPLGFIVRYQ
jgi:hypothetical protein